MLDNEHRVLRRGQGRLLVAGVTDLSAGRIEPRHTSDPAAAVAGAPDCDCRILLAHQPRSAYAAEGLGFDLQLSGHTHGGQYFPGTWLIHLVQPFAAGLHRVASGWVYTNRGTGYWGPPIRFPQPGEITLLTLRRA